MIPRRRRKRRRPHPRHPPLSVEQILDWADDFHKARKRWPTRHDGVIPGSLGETWARMNKALHHGYRGLPARMSLTLLLHEQRQAPHMHKQPRLSEARILAWADAHHARTGHWPRKTSGPVAGAPGETWAKLDTALRHGLRGLPAGSSLPRLLQRRRGAANVADRPRLDPDRIAAWARRHRRRTGRWPTRASGAVPGVTGETWSAVDAALHNGGRGLRAGGSLARLLARRCGVPNPADRPPLTVRQVLAWADAHRRRTGAWPRPNSGPVHGAAGETWAAINKSLRCGQRGLPAGPGLVELLVRRRGLYNAWHAPPLSVRQVLAWADAWHKRHGQWPTAGCGVIPGTPNRETWKQVNAWLVKGRRNLPGGSSLARLLAKRRGVPLRGSGRA